MLVVFSSVATESITMFGDVALKLIRMLGASGTIPSAISAKEIPDALRRLRQGLQAAEPDPQTATDENDDRDTEPPVALATRAQPLITMLERAAAADAPVMWEKR